MAADGRHLRTRWILAAAGWLLWAVSVFMPCPKTTHLWDIYPQAIQAIAKLDLAVSPRARMIETAALFGFVLASGVFLISPVLLICCHSFRPKVRQWRWTALGLLGMAQLTVMLLTTKVGPALATWPAHLLVFSHLIVCIAIIPWPRETGFTQSGFDVIIPDAKDLR